jgi:hypothetical protein
MRRASRTDSNQAEIVEEFRRLGCSVAHTHQIGHGFPDIVVGKNRRTILIEIKDGSKPLSARCLTPDEINFHRAWQGEIDVVENVYDVGVIVERLDR